MFSAGWGHYCTETPGAKSVGDEPLTALSNFKTNSYCWASGLKVTSGASYRLRLKIEEPWLDRTILTDARGFETLAPMSETAYFIWRPFLRWAFNGWLQPIARVGKHGDEEWPLDSKDQTGPLGLIDPQCPGAPKRYEKSAEYCEFHSQNGECERRPPDIGWFDPLPDNEMEGVTLAWNNALSRSGASNACLVPIKARETLESDFIAHKDGELFLFANDSMPVLGALGDFYRNNRGTATVTLQRLPSTGALPAPSYHSPLPFIRRHDRRKRAPAGLKKPPNRAKIIGQ
jgi:hypothetical protein